MTRIAALLVAASAVARPSIAGDDWQDPAFLETLIPRATPVSVSEADTRTVRLSAR